MIRSSAHKDWMRRARVAMDSADDVDPLGGVVNLFDASMVLVVALLLALAGSVSLAEVAARMSTRDITIVTDPGGPDMEMIVKRGNRIERLRSSDERGAGRGQRLGVAYRLESGEVIYVPEAE
ncbi:MAG: DUF2149 domain-containing protein [Bryobacterales bacterium]|nr:DUF2149 domain-containing protein [Bryobacterales bacterium]